MDGDVWQAKDARDRFKDIINAAQEKPQIIRRRGEDVVVVVSARLWEQRKPTLKEWLLSDEGRVEDLLGEGLPEGDDFNPIEIG